MGRKYFNKERMDAHQEEDVGAMVAGLAIAIVFTLLIFTVCFLGCVFCGKLCKIVWSPNQDRRHVTVVNKCCCEGKCREEENAVELGSNKTEQDPEAPPAYEEVVLRPKPIN